MTCGFLILTQPGFCKKKNKKKTMWLIGVEVEQETNAPSAKKNPGSAPGMGSNGNRILYSHYVR